MGVDLRLYVPPHVYLDDLICIIKRLYRDPDLMKEKLRLNSNLNCNFEQPSSPKNSWYFMDSAQKDSASATSIPSMVICKYKFFGKEPRMFYWHYENHDFKKETLGYKLVSAKSHPLHIALATKLVKIFGGRLTFCDSSDSYDLVVTDKEALYSRKNFITEDPDSHFYNIINFANKLPHISFDELVEANGHAAYSFDDSEAEQYAQIIQEYTSLHEKEIITKSISATSLKEAKNTKKLKL